MPREHQSRGYPAPVPPAKLPTRNGRAFGWMESAASRFRVQAYSIRSRASLSGRPALPCRLLGLACRQISFLIPADSRLRLLVSVRPLVWLCAAVRLISLLDDGISVVHQLEWNHCQHPKGG